ncbi:uncharacterized protein EI97DRAFT_383067 [Westerdykella ornata]|uniref:Extensin domain-containing protein n=1 Tax=Westerdykella ornata TaxID=318751 RepID=A0A6A6JAV3_WESOR|nr:uncharacterized protein EI97DRAFT_383067 [Westerdykella ornata]KAF2273731.1 hypothetical protein EI97DRAFT_383067 [Westerdykella ornata]
MSNQPTHTASVVLSEEEMAADADEPPDLQRTPRPSALKLHDSFKASFSKRPTTQSDRKESLLTSALHSNGSSPVEELPENVALRRGMSSASSWSNNSASTAELTSDGGLTSPGTRTRTPSPPAPSVLFPNTATLFSRKDAERPVSIVRHDDDHVGPTQKPASPPTGVQDIEAALARKRCIKFACNNIRQGNSKPATEATKAPVQSEPTVEPPKRACTIKFACPTKVSNNGPSMGAKVRAGRAISPAPQARKARPSPKPASKLHRDSNSTARDLSPESVRKQTPIKSQARRLSISSDLGRSEAYRFHEFAGSEEEEDEWLQESTCHASRLTVRDTLAIENRLRQLGEEAEEEALDEEEAEDQDDEGEDAGDDEDDDDLDDNDEDDEEEYESDEGFQTDDEDGFAGSDNESDAGSDFAWWAPGADSTAATSVDYIRPVSQQSRSPSESSINSRASEQQRNRSKTIGTTRRSRPVNIRVPSPELPDSTDFVCGTLDEDRPLEAAYMSCLERRRAAKHKLTPQDIDPTFPTSDPEMDEEDEDDDEQPDRTVVEAHEHMMQHGQMDQLHYDGRGRTKGKPRRSPALSPKRLRSPPPPTRAGHRSPPPRKLFGQSPRRLRSPAPNVRLRSPPPTRRDSSNVVHVLPRRPGMTIQFGGLAERPAMTMSSSAPRTPVPIHPSGDYEDEDTACELPMRRAIDIKVGLEKRRQRRREQQYRKAHRKGGKDKRPAPGKGVERMREMGLGLAAHRGKNMGFAFGMPPTPDEKGIHVLSV